MGTPIDALKAATEEAVHDACRDYDSYFGSPEVISEAVDKILSAVGDYLAAVQGERVRAGGPGVLRQLLGEED